MEFILPLLLGVGLLSLFVDGSDSETEETTPDTPPLPTDGDDTVLLTDSADLFLGGDGDDNIDGGDGNDALYGGDGNDTIEGGLGQDELFGGGDYDDLSGGASDDTLTGGIGFDDLDGGDGSDELYGDNGKDLLEAGAGDDELYGGSWDDGLFGGSGDDNLFGGNSDDLLSGGDGTDDIFGGAGDDLLEGGAGPDDLNGGDGDDLLVGSQVLNRDLTAEDYQELRAGTLTNNGVGSGLFNNYWGLAGADGDQSTDTLNGGAGDDYLLLGENDIVIGGDGEDAFAIGDWIDGFREATITDFDATEDIIVIFLKETNLDATIDVFPDGDDQRIFVNGAEIARVQGTFDPVDGLDANIVTAQYRPAI